MSLRGERRVLVGLIGHIGSGKTSIANYLEGRGFLRVTLSDFLMDEAKARGLTPTRKNLQDLGDELRRVKGGSVLVRRALEKAEHLGSTRLVIDGLRNPDEVRAVREVPNALLIGVTRSHYVDDENTEVAAVRREKSNAEPAWGQRVSDSMKMATFVIDNSGSLDELYERVSSLLPRSVEW
jgi:dephospho-CoA kinase